MNWGLIIAGGGVAIAAVGFLFPVIIRSGKTEQKVDANTKSLDGAHDHLRRHDAEMSDMRVLLERVDANTSNIKETVEKLEAKI